MFVAIVFRIDLLKIKNMKKLVVVLVGVFFTSVALGQGLGERALRINAGLGFNSSNWGVPIYAGLDYSIHPDITAGAVLSYASRTYNYEVYSNKGTWVGIGVKGDYHFNSLLEIPNNWDVYAGLTLSYNYFSYDQSWAANYSNYDTSGLGLSIQIGGRYYFNEQWAINLELGGNSIASSGKLGVSYNF